MNDLERALRDAQGLSTTERRRLAGMLKAGTGGHRPTVAPLTDEEADRIAPGARQALKLGVAECLYLDDRKRVRARLLASNWLEHDPLWVGWVR